MTEEARRGIPSARANLWTARIAAERYLDEARATPQNKYAMMLYYGSFFVFARAAVQAIARSDAPQSLTLTKIQKAYFTAHIAQDPIYLALVDERHRVAHGDDAWAVHPFVPLGMLARHEKEGRSWADVVFQEAWPDGVLKGMTVEQAMQVIWRKVSDWLDAIDAADASAQSGG